MRKTIATIFVISTLVVLVLCSACVWPGSEKPAVDGGLTQVTVPVETSRISFEVALQNLKDYRTDSPNGAENVKRIYYILAKDVDDSGRAMSWVFEVNYDMEDRLLIYDKSGWTVFPKSNTTLPSEEIAVDNIISPGNLIARNKAIITSTSSSAIPEIRDLELQHGIYTLTLYSGSKGRILKFNTTTGVLIA
jgi:hypothetical protein